MTPRTTLSKTDTTRIVLIIALALTIAGSLGLLLSAPVVAQNGTAANQTTPSTTSSPTPTPTITPTPDPGPVEQAEQQAREAVGQTETETETPEQNATQLEEQLGALNIHSVEWVEGDAPAVVLTVTWTGETPTTVSTLQMVDPDSSSVDIGIDQTRIRPDAKMKIRLSLTEMDPVIVSTPESIDNQNALVLSHNPNSGEDVRLLHGVLLGIAVGGAGTVTAVWRRYKSVGSVERTTEDGGLL